MIEISRIIINSRSRSLRSYFQTLMIKQKEALNITFTFCFRMTVEQETVFDQIFINYLWSIDPFYLTRSHNKFRRNIWRTRNYFFNILKTLTRGL